MKGYGSPQSGFTLIELMIVVLIILVLSGGSITSYLNFNKTETVKNDARSLTTEINRVKTLASSLQYPEGCTTLEGYNLKSDLVDGALTGVTVTVLCDPDNIANPTVKLLGSTIFSAPFDITFLPGNGYLSSGEDTLITIANASDGAATKTLTIGAYGTIKSN